ncbi:MAG: hypothetical protein NZ851_01375 [Aquificaceae bacterium]|nr:hypothetical protein [Aquificaceae bacterium]
MRLYLTAKAGTEVEVVNMLGELDRAVRKLKLDYSGGKYSARKNCYYEKGRWKCTGYTGDIEYSFRLSDPKAQNEILETVDNIKNKYGEKIEYSINQPQWVITEKQFTEAEKELRLNIIYSALDFTKQVSSMIGKQCNISGIDFDTKQTFFGPPIYIRSLGMQMEKAVEAPEPKREDKGVSIKAKISIICVEQLTK